MSAHTELDVVVAVLTYRRPDDLAELLPQLIHQAEASAETVQIVVVDNDPAGGARQQVAELGSERLRYVHEIVPGISAARNRALDSAHRADVLVFIDDDERPSPQWLALLLATYRAGRPAAVVGPVISDYPHEPEEWIRAGRFFERRRLPTGTPLTVAATNNLLLDMRQLHGIRFDSAFGLSGGSDTLFTRQLVEYGGRMVWCDEAIVYDIVPAARLTRDWVLNRAYRSGNSWSRTSLRLASPGVVRFGTRIRLTASGLARLTSGGAQRIVGGVSRNLHLEASGLRRLRRGGGMLAGAWGSTYSEYGRS